MGSGKTSWAIEKMNWDDKSYIYITPFLSEVQRIKEFCSDRKFVEPKNFGDGKLDNLHTLLEKGHNIASTHALFKTANDVTKELIKAKGYTLILDEVMDVVEQVPLKKDDLPSLLELELVRVEDNFLIWNEDKMDYDGKYNEVKHMAKNGNLIVVNNTVLMWTFPADIFKSFEEVYILTYLFKGQIQKYYYDLYNIEYNYYTVLKDKVLNSYYIKEKEIEDDREVKSILKNKIHIFEGKLNDIGEKDFSLSSSWFDKSVNKSLFKVLKDNLFNFFKNKYKAKSNNIIWTTYKSSKSKLSGNGYAKSFLVLNSRSTNEYKDRKYLAYCCNLFINPLIVIFFNVKNLRLDEDTYALSEMLQWTWRSAIRDDKEINIYIPSKRMRNLFIKWLNNNI